MDKSIFQKYIDEMRAFKASAVPTQATPAPSPAPTPEPSRAEPNSEDMAGVGRLIVQATSVRGLYPVERARVTVFTEDVDNPNIIAEVYTDKSGRTPLIELPAPSSVFTEAPDPSERPYSYYNIRTVADGFVDTLHYNIAVFDKITSIQNVNLLPVSSEIEKNRPIVIDDFDDYTL